MMFTLFQNGMYQQLFVVFPYNCQIDRRMRLRKYGYNDKLLK